MGLLLRQLVFFGKGMGENKATTQKNKGIKITLVPKFSSQQLLVLWIPQ
jgi:hypothetical protein